jgi:hypothetical protein
MTPEEFFAAYQPDVQAMGQHLRTLVKTVLPDMQEIVFTGWKNVSYGTGESQADKDLICYIAPYTRSVNLGFYRGALLTDPHNCLAGTGKLLRHIKFAKHEQINNEIVLELLMAARRERLGNA